MGWFAFFICLVLSPCKGSVRSPYCGNVCFCCWMYCYRWWWVDQSSVISPWELHRRWAWCHCVTWFACLISGHMKCIIFAPFLLVGLFRGWVWDLVVSWSTGDCRGIYFPDPTLNLQYFPHSVPENSLLCLCTDAEIATVALSVFAQQELGPSDTRWGAALPYSNNIAHTLILT